jgi:anti-sigma-K factor RskA
VNVQEYILSGIVESYVLGLASREDSIEFERMCAAYSEVRAARNSFELELEGKLLEQKIEPPRELKPRIFSEIGMEKDEQPPRIPLPKPTLVPRAGFARYVAAASLILLAGSVLLNLYLLDQYKKSIAQYKELSARETQVAGANQVLQTKLNAYENALNLMKNPMMAIVKMPGTPNSPAPSSMATVYWNTESKDVYLLVNQLPKPVTGKQYQLWAIVDGKPVDAGTFNLGEGVSFVKLKTIPRAEAFAITLEKTGGSETPTMDAMYVMGKVTG